MQNDESMTDAEKAAFALHPEIQTMFEQFADYRAELLPSKMWQALNHKNLQQLVDSGYDNFKRTLARNYFTWIVHPLNPQVRFLMRMAGFSQTISIAIRAVFSPRHELLKRRHSIYYNLLTELLWAFVENHAAGRHLEFLTEPLEGNPPLVTRKGRLISQDLANSVLEYEGILHQDIDRREIRTIMELGPGYGRTAYVFLALQANCRYILVDIPPALYVAQRYLSNVFAERRIFGFRAFDKFADVREDYENAEIIFLTPNQLELLPDNSVDLFINISSLHEMRMDQIRFYFTLINRLTRKYFYFKQWKTTTVPLENEKVSEADYPVGDDWKLIYRRQCEVQSKFFEALYEMPDQSTIRDSLEAS